MGNVIKELKEKLGGVAEASDEVVVTVKLKKLSDRNAYEVPLYDIADQLTKKKKGKKHWIDGGDGKDIKKMPVINLQ